jgi:hypothetical protein
MSNDLNEKSKTTLMGETSRNAFRKLRLGVQFALWAASLVVAVAGPASADFVCNAKTKLVNVFLEPPVYRKNVGAPAAGGKWSPADIVEKPFDIVDTLPSGARVKMHASIGPWVWVAFRHSQTGLVGNGYVLASKLSSIPCDADPKTATGYADPDDDYYFGTGLDELDDPPLDGARGAKRFETSMLSGAVSSSEILIACEQPPQDTSDFHFRVRACSKLLAVNPNYIEALINRGDIYHIIAKTPSRDIDSKSPQWAADIKSRKEAQEKAIADWRRAALLLGKEFHIQILGDRLASTGAAGYEIK